jgi:hypothetical protein
MNIKLIITSILKERGYTLTDVVRLLNEKNEKKDSLQNLSNKLTKETLRYKEALEIAEAIGCKIEWIEKGNSYNVSRTNAIISETKSSYSYSDYLSENTDQIFLHGIKRHAQHIGISEQELFIKILHLLNHDLLKENIKTSPE